MTVKAHRRLTQSNWEVEPSLQARLDLLSVDAIDVEPSWFLREVGRVFAVFDARTQDSGNVSYGVEVPIGGQAALRAGTPGSGGDGGNQHLRRYFVKTAGDPDDNDSYLDHAGRVALLENAVRLAGSCGHPALARLHHVISSPVGPMLVYEWVEGELLGGPRERREHPDSPYRRFSNLPVDEILAVLDVIYDLHKDLAAKGWVACDFYDGCLIYDFDARRVRVIDLDNYHQGPFHNQMGRMFGSTRFMAPEEFELGAVIDQQTTVYTLGRTGAIFLSRGYGGDLDRQRFRAAPELFAVMERACRRERSERFPTVAEFWKAWHEARTG